MPTVGAELSVPCQTTELPCDPSEGNRRYEPWRRLIRGILASSTLTMGQAPASLWLSGK